MDNSEIKVGDYIRSKDGYIDKVERIVYDELEKKNYYVCEKSVMASGFKEDIVKHSSNILELIQVRDIIKYIEQTEGREGAEVGETYITDIHSENELEEIKKEIQENGIKLLSIVTKEQLKSVEFRLEE